MTALITHLGGARATVGLACILIGLGGDARLAGLTALVANALSHAAVQVLKRTVQRPRPCDADGHPLALVDLPDPFSFPSGHAAAAWSVALSLAFVAPVTAALGIPVAAWVAWSRVRLRVHFPGDVAAGICLGLLGALAAKALLL